MINLIKSQIKKLIILILFPFSKTRIGKIVSEKILYLSMKNVQEVIYSGCKLKFVDLNWITRFRIDTFATKEPETLAWIDTFENETFFWDIGANIGLYSVYAAKRYNCKVCAFEPSIFNLELLGRNISLNGLTDNVTIIPIPLTDRLLENKFSTFLSIKIFFNSSNILSLEILFNPLIFFLIDRIIS